MNKRNYLKGGRRNWAIRFEDRTPDCGLPEFAQVLVDADKLRIIACYLIDPGSITYCCSITPGFYAVELCSFVNADSDAWESLSESQREELDTWTEGGEVWHGYLSVNDESLIDSGVQFLRNGYDPETGNMNDAEECLREWQSGSGGLENLYMELRNEDE